MNYTNIIFIVTVLILFSIHFFIVFILYFKKRIKEKQEMIQKQKKIEERKPFFQELFCNASQEEIKKWSSFFEDKNEIDSWKLIRVFNWNIDTLLIKIVKQLYEACEKENQFIRDFNGTLEEQEEMLGVHCSMSAIEKMKMLEPISQEIKKHKEHFWYIHKHASLLGFSVLKNTTDYLSYLNLINLKIGKN